MKIDVETHDVETQCVADAAGQCIFLIDPDIVNRSTLYYMIPDSSETCELESLNDILSMQPLRVPDVVIVNALLVAKYSKALIQGWRIAWPQVKVLLICEACDTECVTAAKAAGADETLQRPFKYAEVRSKLKQPLEPPGLNPAELNMPPNRRNKNNKHSAPHAVQ